MNNIAASEKLIELWSKGTKFLNTENAILGGAMSWISESNLVSAISNAGGFGIIACGSMSPELLDKEIKATQKLTQKSFGVNLITMHPQLHELIEVCSQNNIKYIVLAGGLPKASTINKIHHSSATTICFAPSLSIAKRLIKLNVGAIIIEGMEAGGHIGPVSTSVLAQEILPEIGHILPVFVAGGIGRGELIASYLEMGASGCQLGTRFVCSTESIAHANFKNKFISSNARHAVPSIQINQDFPVIPVRAIENKATKEFLNVQIEAIELYNSGKLSKVDAQLKIEHFWAGALKKAVIDGDVEHGSVMAGQSVGLVNKIEPVRDIIDRLVTEANNFLSNK
ncbi:MAG: nitronate monooxygenase [Pseudomonadota bacterium]